ncbi:hypothetical protein HK099_000081 [Clydaea vesicula]|uniref:HECT-type E3 ubiquitin transferase n=1 Tax=Clydaea vesicula TaxID=447962 RepID=A0AAD5U892_9FUNG|nr:hypothetical protein HK099_000081 [Clydaea vesicula]
MKKKRSILPHSVESIEKKYQLNNNKELPPIRISKFPQENLKESAKLTEECRINPKASFVEAKRVQAIIADREKFEAEVKKMLMSQAAFKCDINFELLRPLTRDPHFVAMIKEFEKETNTAQGLALVPRPEIPRSSPIPPSKTKLKNNATEVSHYTQVNSDHSNPDWGLAMNQIYQYIEKSKFKPLKPRTPQNRFKDVEIGRPLCIKEEKTEEFNHSFRELVSLGHQLAEKEYESLTDKMFFGQVSLVRNLCAGKKTSNIPLVATAAAYPPNNEEKFLVNLKATGRKAKSLKAQNLMEHSKTKNDFSTVTSNEVATFLESPVIKWRSDFEKVFKNQDKNLKKLLREREDMRLEACKKNKTVLPVIEMIQKDLERNLTRGKHYEPSWSGLLPHIWVKETRSIIKAAQRRRNAQANVTQINLPIFSRKDNRFDNFLAETPAGNQLKQTPKRVFTPFNFDKEMEKEIFINMGRTMTGKVIEERKAADIKELVFKLTSCSDETIIEVEADLRGEWHYQKSDFYHFVPVLNRFDTILEVAAKEMKDYKSSKNYQNKSLLLAVLKLTKLFWENCTSRNLYSSFEHLADLLYSWDLDILDVTIRLLFRPAQRVNIQRSVRSGLQAVSDRVAVLAVHWEMTDQLFDFTVKEKSHVALGYQFYKKAATNFDEKPCNSIESDMSTPNISQSTPVRTSTTTTFGQPTPQRAPNNNDNQFLTPQQIPFKSASQEGLVSIYIPNPHLQIQSEHSTKRMSPLKKVKPGDGKKFYQSEKEMLIDTISEYDVPEEHVFPILHRLRVAVALGSGDLELKRKLSSIRLLSIAVWVNMMTDEASNSKLFLYEPDLIQKCADLLVAERNIPYDLQTSAIYVLDSIFHQRSKQSEVLTAINASVNHGVLMYSLQSVTNYMNEENKTKVIPQEYIEALLSFIGYVVTIQSGGAMLLSAGIIVVLVSVMDNRLESQRKNVVKCMNMLDAILYQFSTSYPAFTSAKGLDILVRRIKDEVYECTGNEASSESLASDQMDVEPTSTSRVPHIEVGDIPVERILLLRQAMKFILHLMQSFGTADGMRNLIDTSLPNTILRIFESKRFGASIFGLAVNIMSTFIHNEPTSLSILQEASLPQSFLKVVLQDFPISAEVVSALPNAFGAICLNQAGLDAFKENLPIQKFMDVFTNSEHILTLLDSDVPHLVGGSLDELIRHHPTLKSDVFDAIGNMLNKVLLIGENQTAKTVEEDDNEEFYELFARKDSSDDINMSDGTVATSTSTVISEDKNIKKELKFTKYVDVVSKLLDGLFQNNSHAKEFSKTKSMETLLKYCTLNSIPYDFATSTNSSSLGYIFRILMDANHSGTISLLIKVFYDSISNIKEFLDYSGPGGYATSLVDISENDPTLTSKRKVIRNLVTLHFITKLVGDIFTTHLLSQTKAVSTAVQIFGGDNGQLFIGSYTKLHRVVVWENILLKLHVDPKWYNFQKGKKGDKEKVLPETTTVVSSGSHANLTSPTVRKRETSSSVVQETENADFKDYRVRNTQILKYLFTELPKQVSATIQALGKVMVGRRAIEASVRSTFQKVMANSSRSMVDHLIWPRIWADDGLAKYDYLKVLLSYFSVILMDDRNGTSFLLTGQVKSFVEVQGLDALLEMSSRLWGEYLVVIDVQPRPIEKCELIASSLELIFNVLQTFSNFKLLMDSPFTSALQKDKDKVTSDSAFEPHEHLVKMRSSILAKIKVFWYNPKLKFSSKGLIKSMIHLLCTILKADGEVKIVEVFTGPPRFINRLIPDEDKIQQLVDMGFPRAAAEVALLRCSNHVARAAEYLLLNPDVINTATIAATANENLNAAVANNPPQPENHASSERENVESAPPSEAVEDQVNARDSAGEQQDLNRVDEPMGDVQEVDRTVSPLASSETAQIGEDSSVVVKPSGDKGKLPAKESVVDSFSSIKSALDNERELIKKDLFRIAISLLDGSEDIVFEVKEILCLKDDISELVSFLLSEIQFVRSQTEINEKALSARLRLFALIVNDPKLERKVVVSSQHFITELLELVEASPLSDKPTTSLPSILLILEAFISLGDELRPVALDRKPSDYEEPERLERIEPLTYQKRLQVLKIINKLLENEDTENDTVFAMLRIVVRLTRDQEICKDFVKLDGLRLLFSQKRIGAFGAHPVLVKIILRHIIENKAMLQNLMEHEISVIMKDNRSKTLDLKGFIKSSAPLITRDPDCFVDATRSVCRLAMFEPWGLQTIAAKKEETSVIGEEASALEKMNLDANSLVTPPLKHTSTDTSEILASFFVNEILALKNPDISPVANLENDEDAIHLRRCFLLHCVAELVSCYTTFKSDILNITQRKGKNTPLHKGGKNSFFNHLLNDILPFGQHLSPLDLIALDVSQKKKYAESMAVEELLNGICSFSLDLANEKKHYPEVVEVRKAVFDAIAKSIKDALNSAGSTESKYDRFFSISDLCSKLLAVDEKPLIRRHSHSGDFEETVAIAKLMLEKNFVHLFTQLLNEVDIQHPNSQNLLNKILKPLEKLTKIAIRTGRPLEKKKDNKANTAEGLISDIDQDRVTDTLSHQAATQNAITDIYRNSALGMFSAPESGEDDNSDSSDSDDMDEDDYDEEFSDDEGEDEDGFEQESDVEDEMEIVVPSTYHNAHDNVVTTTDDEEDNEGDETGNVTGDEVNEMGWEDASSQSGDEVDERNENRIHHEEEASDEDRDEDEDPDDDDDEEEDSSEENDIAEIEFGDDVGGRIDQDMFMSIQPIGGRRSQFSRRGGNMRIPARHLASFEDFSNEIRGLQNYEIHLNADAHTAAASFQPFSGNDIRNYQIPTGGVPLPAFSAPNDSIISHPLLVNQSLPANNLQRSESRRRSPNRDILDLSAIEDIMGGNTMQILEQIFRGSIGAGFRGLSGTSMRIDRTDQGVMENFLSQTPPVAPTGVPSSPAIISNVSEAKKSLIYSLSILYTTESIAQEAKMMYGSLINEKALPILNAIVNALEPAAREEDEKRRERETAARKIRQAEEKKKAEELEEKKRLEEEKKRKEEEEAEKIRAEEARIAAEQAVVANNQPEDIVMEEAAAISTPMDTAESSAAAAPAERVIVMVDGNPVDITDFGIDKDFLEALPDEMRQEVLANHLREQRATQQTDIPDTISNDFLDALPPDIREEIIQNERAEASRREREAARLVERERAREEPAAPVVNHGVFGNQFETGLPGLWDTALPSPFSPMIMAEASALRNRISRSRQPNSRLGLPVISAAEDTGKKLHREAVQLVDRGALMSLLRLLFVPEPINKTLIQDLLVNVAENSRTRTELLSLLLSVLSEGCADLAAVDKKFSQLSKGKGKANVTPKKKNYINSASLNGSVPNLIELRCLETIHTLANSNSLVINWFLVGNETLSHNLNKTPKSSQKKNHGKGISAPVKSPVVFLLELLERPSFLKNSSIMGQLMSLLTTLLKPLSNNPLKNTVRKLVTGESTRITPSAENSAEIEEPALAEVSDTTAPEVEQSVNQTQSTGGAISEIKVSESLDASSNKEDLNKSEVTSPYIPSHCIRAVILVLTSSECTNKTFQHTLSVIQHLLSSKENEVVIIESLVTSVSELGTAILPDLKELSLVMETSSSNIEVRSALLGNFSKPSATQSKLLRVLKTLDFIHSKSSFLNLKMQVSPSNDKNNEINEKKKLEKEEEEKTLRKIYDGFKLYDVWVALGKGLEIINDKSNLLNVGTVLLPLIESFMVVSKPYVLGHRNVLLTTNVSKPDVMKIDPMKISNEQLFFSFTEEHKKILNTMVRNTPGLMNGSFSLLVQNPKVLEFDNKRTYFNQQLHKRPNREHYGTLQINVRRQYVFEDSYHQLQGRSGKEIKYGKLSVRFYDEEGVDAGGVTREWFSVLARQMFNPDYALFKPSAVDKITYQPNRASWINPDHLSYLKFVGRIIGKAIYDGRLLDCYFTRSFYKAILETNVDWKDMEAVDPEFHKSLDWMLNNDITDVLDLTFSCEMDDFGRTKVVDLKPNGSNVAVTEENKQEYIKLITELKLQIAIKDQLAAFLSGFQEIIPKDLIKIFNEQELELLISGLPDIDIDDWKNNTEYQNYTPTSPQIQWFWRVVRNFTQEERAKLIQFVTGTSKVPLEGFSDLQGSNGIQKFQIHKDYSSNTRLPSAHTCFNQIDLPEYESYEQLRTNLLTSINEGGTGFGFA